MREIKFRVAIYDFNKEKYLIKKDLVLANSIWSNADISLNEIIKNAKNLMQYTGLKDKNDVEIYEGDIVKDLRSLFIDNRANSRVFYQEDRGRYVFGGWEIPAGMMHTFEVIGNIYENPELLKGE